MNIGWKMKQKMGTSVIMAIIAVIVSVIVISGIGIYFVSRGVKHNVPLYFKYGLIKLCRDGQK